MLCDFTIFCLLSSGDKSLFVEDEPADEALLLNETMLLLKKQISNFSANLSTYTAYVNFKKDT